MSRRARLTIAAAVALISAIGIPVLAVQLATTGNGRAPLPFGLPAREASPPFAAFRETNVKLDGSCRSVVVADTERLREQGLRGYSGSGAYAGMLFVSAHDTDTAFTMAGVTTPLEISWYSAGGTRVGGAHLAPCPNRDQAHCPAYRSRRRYRLALETFGASPSGGIAPCG